MDAEQLDLFDQPIPPVVTRLTFNQAMRFFRLVHFSKTKDNMRAEALCRYMVEFFNGKFIDVMGRQDTKNVIHWLRTEKELGGWSLIKARGILRLMFNMYEIWKEDGEVAGHDLSGLLLPRKNPTFKTDRPKPSQPTVFISPFEFRGWIKAARIANDWSFEAAFKFGLWFRLSPIDLENFNDDEVDEQAFEIRLNRRHTITDKNPGGCPQTIKLREKAWALIERCRRYRKPGEKRIIQIQINKRRRFAKIRKIAVGMGLRDITLSVFRRSASDHLLGKGFSKEAVADGMGHTTTKMLDPHYSSKKHAPFRGEITEELTRAFSG